MNGSVVGAIVAVAVVVVVAVLARRAGRADDTGMPPAPGAEDADAPPDPAAAAPEPEDDDWEDIEVVAVTSEGFALVPDAHAVRQVPPHEEGEAWKAGATARNRRGERALGMSWQHGDFTGARIVRGAADEGPWRLEALGRDGEYTAFVFETREGADAALGLFTSRGVVQLGHDESGAEAPPSPEQFEEARRVFLETEAALGQEFADEGDEDRR